MSPALRLAGFLLAAAIVFAPAAHAQYDDAGKSRWREENKYCTLKDAYAAYSKGYGKNRDDKAAMEALRSECGMVIKGAACSVQEFLEVMATRPTFKALKLECKG